MLGVRCDVDIFKLTASAQFIYEEIYDSMQKYELMFAFEKNVFHITL